MTHFLVEGILKIKQSEKFPDLITAIPISEKEKNGINFIYLPSKSFISIFSQDPTFKFPWYVGVAPELLDDMGFLLPTIIVSDKDLTLFLPYEFEFKGYLEVVKEDMKYTFLLLGEIDDKVKRTIKITLQSFFLPEEVEIKEEYDLDKVKRAINHWRKTFLRKLI